MAASFTLLCFFWLTCYYHCNLPQLHSWSFRNLQGIFALAYSFIECKIHKGTCYQLRIICCSMLFQVELWGTEASNNKHTLMKSTSFFWSLKLISSSPFYSTSKQHNPKAMYEFINLWIQREIGRDLSLFMFSPSRMNGLWARYSVYTERLS